MTVFLFSDNPHSLKLKIKWYTLYGVLIIK